MSGGWVDINVGDIPKDWKELSSIDESEDYEVDQTWIYEGPDDKYYLVHASGCSCWDGEATYKEFPNLFAIGTHFFSGTPSYYAASDRANAELLAEAYKNFRG